MVECEVARGVGIHEALGALIALARTAIGTSEPRELASALLALSAMPGSGRVAAPDGIRLVVRPETELVKGRAMGALAEGWPGGDEPSAGDD